MRVILALITGLVLSGTAFAVDVTIKDVPEGAVEDVKHMASVAVERYLAKEVKPAESVKAKFELDVDSFREANKLPTLYKVIEPIKAEPVSNITVKVKEDISVESINWG